MKNYAYYTRLLVLFLLVGVYSSCDQQGDTKNKEITTITPVKEKKKKKDPNRTLGIEHMAQYQKEIRKPIDAEKSTYKEGYLMAEFQKAKNNSFSSKKASTITDISERGPANVPGRTRGIAIAPDSQDKWYIGTVGGGIWVTEDAGVTWATLTDFKIPSLGTSTIVASQTTAGKLYVGTGEPFGNLDAIGGVGLLKTIDDGTNWEFLANTAAFGDIGRMVLNPMDDDNLIVASASGIYVTTDGGTTWSNTYSGVGVNTNVQDLVADPTNFNTMYAGVRQVGVIKSTDGGLTWTQILDEPYFATSRARFELSISPANTDKLFVSVYSTAAVTAVNTDFYVSSDAGATFSLLGFTGDPEEGNLVTGQGWYDNVITAHPFDENIFYSGGVAIFKVTIDQNMNYTAERIASGYGAGINTGVHVDQHNFVVDLDPANPNQFRLIAANDGGVYSTAYGTDPSIADGAWTATASSLNCTQFYGADKQNGADNYLAGAQDNGSWISNEAGGADETTAYIFRLGGDGFEVVWNYEDPTKYIVGSQFNNFAQYNSVQPFLAPHGDTGATGSPFYSKVTNANNNPDVVFSPGKNGVWRSTDFAENWILTPITSAYVPNQSNPNSGVSSAIDVEVSVANPNIVWAGSAMTETASFTLHVSEDNGLSFSPTEPFLDPRGGDFSHFYFISGIEASPTEPNRAYALFSGQGAAKVLKTEDLGQTWTDISGFSTGTNTGFPDVAVHSLIEMPYDANTLWAGTDIGLFESTDGGANWAIIPGLPTVAIYQMKIVNDQVVMATHGRGVWSVTLAELDGYEPAPYFAPPTIVSAVQAGIDSQNAIATFSQQNENVESVTVFLDGAQVDIITENIEPTDGEISYTFENLSEGPHTIGFKVNSATIESVVAEEEVVVIDFATPSEDVSIGEFVASDVYTFGGEFVIDNIGGITNQNVLNNSEHPYANGTTYNTVLKRPIIVSADTPNFTYEDVAMVEPGDADGEWDLVFIEASTDLNNWVELDVYDARRFQEWLDVYNAGNPQDATITDDLFKSQTIDLTSFFNPGDEIVVRFRLFTDTAVQSFGWAIRNINKPAVLSTDDVVFETTDFKVYPTASFGDVTIRPGKNIDNSVIEVFGLDGKRYFTDNANLKGNAEYKLSLSSLSPGFYLVAVSTKDNSFSRVERIMIK